MIEFSDNDSKMTLQYRFEKIIEHQNSNLQSNSTEKNMEILQQLPSDVVIIRQNAMTSMEDNDYRELIDTNSETSTSGCTVAKVKRISQIVKNKTREMVEVRRNPVRISKRSIDKDFSWPKKRLLTNSKREMCLNYEFGKHMKSSTMPYMNTRSITRKMYTIGATYQAPTKRDETEWKEWPAHGMHERPVYHPQAGLAVEYLGRYFTSFDGLSYREIIDGSEIEVVTVDPSRDQRILQKSREKIKMKNKRLSNIKDTWNACLPMKNKSFETCMHGSLHCVLGYCSQVMSPVYKQAVVEKVMKLAVPAVRINSPELKKTTYVKSNATNSSENIDKFTEETKLLETYATAMAQSVQKKDINSRSNERVASTFTSSSAMYMPEAQLTEIDGSKTALQSGKVRMNLKQILQNTSNSSLILLRNPAAKISSEICTPIAKNIFNPPPRPENASISDETLIKMSSIYKKLTFINEPTLNCEESPKNNLYTLKRHATNTKECTTKKTFLENQFENKKTVQIKKKIHKNKNTNEMKISRESNTGISMMNSGTNYVWCTNKTSEIARIQSKYNKSISTKSIMQNPIYSSKNMTENSTDLSTKSFLQSNLWQKDMIIEENRNFVTDINVGLDYSHKKWKNLCPTLETTKDNQIADNNQNSWNNSLIQLENHQSLRNSQLNQSPLNCVSKKPIESDNLNKREIIMMSIKSQEMKSECSKNGIETGSLQELLENTAILYCAANGIHQDDLSSYIDFLDNKHNIQWLES
ncbi:protein PF3D7_1417600-like [Linepithema humile]|uniref:protein PF3D7_1417600-like n=1 Tax=Linepithema humile TaxID=83485 RepID=UPI0006234DC9|nr:PREDICTED: uncharacterized protein LOC105669087 [Linepithema humile]XP_012217256.1 PREDICTED: uncharacterized protein LOC105669087 [Linepithema humile]XP_012217257.1 PREDICTED: uncharacterized protein LOC105669087 [Linepithema humile]XP_012217258.1 PREDICTED: uncharacterized protein LOC105669087 [Linepithema humile]XP_012217259.1 PREDICTED: uncharacterized protein LOC105669087 [Linepithema humile]